MQSIRTAFESQGLELTGRLVVPDAPIAGAVLCVTGGGTGGCDESFLEWQQYMAEAQFASLAFNARGIDGSSGAWRTDSDNYDPESMPANSQLSRAQDTIVAYHCMKHWLGVEDDSTGVIGASMGGDITLRALKVIRPAAVVLRAPAAYPDGTEAVPYGPERREVVVGRGGDEGAARTSPNFVEAANLETPLLVAYSRGDTVVGPVVQDRYAWAVTQGGGEFVMVGDETTKHTFLNGEPASVSPVDRIAREQLFATSVNFFQKHLVPTE